MQDALPAKHALQCSHSAGSCAAEAKACRPGKRLFGIVGQDQSEWQPLVRESSQVTLSSMCRSGETGLPVEVSPIPGDLPPSILAPRSDGGIRSLSGLLCCFFALWGLVQRLPMMHFDTQLMAPQPCCFTSLRPCPCHVLPNALYHSFNVKCKSSVSIEVQHHDQHALLQVMEMVGLDTEWMLNDLLACADAVYA